MRISELDGLRLALWGWGREGRAAHAALRRRLPGQRLTVLCRPEEAEAMRALADPVLADPDTEIDTEVDAAKLADFDRVLKSPGISPCREPAAEALRRGARFLGGTALWFAEHPEARVVAVTGSKGKSTTTALIAHLLRTAGHRTALAGNIGLPLLALLDPEPAPEFWAIELSSFQTGDAHRPEVAVVLNLFPEHLDWHGDAERYFADKLALIEHAEPRVAVLNGEDARLAALAVRGRDWRWFGRADGWHARDERLYRGGREVATLGALPLPGHHNRGNVCAALTAVEALGLDALALVPALFEFRPLPHRLQTLGERGGIVCIDDSIATTPQASLAALDTLPGRRVAIVVGGYERGLDWSVFAERCRRAPPAAVICQGASGPRLYDLLAPLARVGGFALSAAENLDRAVELGRAALAGQGVLLLSPGAPSFPDYRDYAERGRHFAELCGFDPGLSAIPGLGIA